MTFNTYDILDSRGRLDNSNPYYLYFGSHGSTTPSLLTSFGYGDELQIEHLITLEKVSVNK